MAYYQILKKRRLDLNLSIQDISIQTHLAPESIRAIEDNQLDVFFDDFQYAKVFIRAYCDAIGVNWSMIEPEVNRQINYYEQKKLYDQAKEQEALEKEKALAAKSGTRKSKPRPKKKKKKRSHPGGINRAHKLLKWDQKNRLAKTMIILGCILIACLILLNFLTDYLSQRSFEQAQLERQAEIKNKEEETERLASQLQSKRDEEKKAAEEAEKANRPPLSPQIMAAANQVNQFYVADVISEDQDVSIIVTGEGGTVTVMQNDTVLQTAELNGSFTSQMNFRFDQTITLIFSNPPGITGITVNGIGVELNLDALKAWTSDRVVFYIVSALPSQETPQPDFSVPDAALPADSTVPQEGGTVDEPVTDAPLA